MSHLSYKKHLASVAILIVGAVLPSTASSSSLQCAKYFGANVRLNSMARPLLTGAIGRTVEIKRTPSPGLADPLLAEARALAVHDDFKYLSDLRRKPLAHSAVARIESEAKLEAELAPPETRRKVYVSRLVEKLYVSGSELMDAPSQFTQPRWEVTASNASRRATFETVENTWRKLVRVTPASSRGSLIPLPHPVIIPGSRFQESYYWDSYFGNQALLRTGREDLAAMQVENFVFMIKNYGLVPNGMRDYYLSRSQPPLVASMAREVAERFSANGKSEAATEWLARETFEVIAKDYREFWMNPETRYDRETGLNHHWDAHDRAREERHSADRDDLLGRTYRDVRAEAESGKDFTDAYGGETTKVAPVLLNSVLYKAELDLAWMARRLGRETEARSFEQAARRRKAAIDRHLWDPADGVYKEYHLDRRERLPILTADIFVPLWAGVSSKEQAVGVRAQLPRLEGKGGVMASEVTSGKQWDAPYGWAPQQFFAMAGLKRFGFADDAQRIGEKWTTTVERIHDQLGVLIEKVDVVRGDKPIETGDKYETQQGFLWTNAVYVWTLTDVLGAKLKRLPKPAAHASGSISRARSIK